MSENPMTSEKKRAFDTYDLTLESTELVTPRNKHLRFRLEGEKSLHFKAGQFVQIFIPQGTSSPGRVRRTSYSIASSPSHRDYFELCVTLVDGGVSSAALHSLKVGDPIQAMGPLGAFVMKDEAADTVFISTGSGVAPFRSMIHDRLEKNTPQKLYLLFGNRHEADIIYRKEWMDLSREKPNFQAMFTLSRATWDGPRGYVQDKIQEFVPEAGKKEYYICGLVNMINAVQEKLLTLGVPKEKIHFERYD